MAAPMARKPASVERMERANSASNDRSPACQVVVIDATARHSAHDAATIYNVAERLAAVLRGEFAGAYNAAVDYHAPLYFVPAETLLQDEAARYAIVSERQLFGGIAPYPFVATKAITHAVPSASAAAPNGWSFALGAALEGQVLPGYTAFSREDALGAGTELLARGAVRIKSTRGIGGSGQHLVHRPDELAAILDDYDDAVLHETGVVIEQHLENVTTYSVGSVHVGDWRIAYCGRQRLTLDHDRRERYGGSDLTFFLGDMHELRDQWDPADSNALRAIAQAIGYDAAIVAAYPALLASRRNYDIAQGHAETGEFVSGVLEQSWRIGGASPAELTALETFGTDERIRSLRASTHEVYALIDPPANATLSYRGEDPHLGALTKYSVIESHGYQTS